MGQGCFSIFVDGGIPDDASNPAYGRIKSTGAVTTKTNHGNTRSEVLFFPDKAMPCRYGDKCHRKSKGKGCKFAHDDTSLVKFLKFIGHAKSTLDICVFNITCDEITSAIISRHKHGVNVRIITDNDTADSKGSDIEECRRSGIPVVMDNSDQLMHNKFAIVDKAFLATGSFNWSRSAVLKNKENVIITTEEYVVSAFNAEFLRLWKEFGGK